LPEVKGLGERVSVWVSMARGLAKEGDLSEAAWPLREALIECGRINLGEDFIQSVLGMVVGMSEQFQTQTLGHALKTVLKAAPALDPTTCEEIVLGSRALFKGMGPNLFAMGEEENLERLNLENLAVEALSSAGSQRAAEGIAREVLESYLVNEGRSVVLLPLLPLVRKFGGADDSARWNELAADVIDEGVSSRPLYLMFLVKEFSAQTHMAGVLPELLELINERVKLRPVADVNLGVKILHGYVSGLLNKKGSARELLNKTLNELSEGRDGTLSYFVLLALWDTACVIGEENLLGVTLDRMIAGASRSLHRDKRVELWMAACESLDAVPDLSLKRAVFDRLRSVATEVVDTQPYLATALLQFADAYATINMHDKASRLLAESLRLQNAALTAAYLVNSLTETARLYNVTGDRQMSAELLGQALDIIAGTEDVPGSEFGKVSGLQTVMPCVGDLARLDGPNHETTAPLLERAVRIVQDLEMAETAVGGACALVHETQGLGSARRSSSSREFFGAMTRS
jgi:hypothetical protein